MLFVILLYLRLQEYRQILTSQIFDNSHLKIPNAIQEDQVHYIEEHKIIIHYNILRFSDQSHSSLVKNYIPFLIMFLFMFSCFTFFFTICT